MARHLEMYSKTAAPVPALDSNDRLSEGVHEPETERSNFAAFLLGGVVIAGGLMAFLYYDNGQAMRNDDIVTGSIMRASPISAPNVQVPLLSRQPANGSAQP